MLTVPRPSAICLLAVMLALLGCSQSSTLVAPDPGLERMVEQPRLDPFSADPASPMGAGMRDPPPGTVAREAVATRGERATGRRGDAWSQSAPIALDLATLRRGQQRFAIACAVCHGLRGDGESAVAEAMAVVKPRNLLLEPYRRYPIGRTFQVIRAGYGVMPAYADMLDLDDSWAVAAYVQVLQLAQAVPVTRLTPAQRLNLAAQQP